MSSLASVSAAVVLPTPPFGETNAMTGILDMMPPFKKTGIDNLNTRIRCNLSESKGLPIRWAGAIY
jgi:hypothetical protein